MKRGRDRDSSESTPSRPLYAQNPAQHPTVSLLIVSLSPLFITVPKKYEYMGETSLPGQLRCFREAAQKNTEDSCFILGLGRKKRREEPHKAMPPGLHPGCCLGVPRSSGGLLIEICRMKWATAVCLDKYILCYMPQLPSVC